MLMRWLHGRNYCAYDRFIYVCFLFAGTNKPKLNIISNTLSDHDIVVLQIKNVQNTQRGKGIRKNNTKIYDLQSFQNELKKRWTKR